MPKLAIDRLGYPAVSPVNTLTDAASRLTPHMLAEVLDAMPEPVYLKDRSHRWVEVNSAFCEYMGRGRSELLGKTESDFLPDREASRAWENDEIVFKTGQVIINEAVADDGEEISRLLQTQKSLLRDGRDNELLLCVIRDLTGTKSASELLRGSPVVSENCPGTAGKPHVQHVSFAFSDPLTQLPNRRAFMNMLDAATTRVAQNAAVFVINLDHFKLVNDRFGHTAGDTVILEVAARLRSSIRVNDILGRLDSDAFIVLADGIDVMKADRIADQILAEIARPLKVGQHEYRVSVSIGIAMLPDHGQRAEELVRNAGIAMNWCKRRSRGGSEFYSDGASSAADRMTTIEFKLPLAVDNGELITHYQPIVRGSDRMVSGFEALARWCDPELGELSPSEFIPIAEEMGLIRRLGQIVLDQACGFTASLTDPGMTVSVNVSGSQLMDPTFPIFVAEMLQRHAITGDRLLLEITESVAMEADTSVWQVFEELSSVGVKLIIDDFGTGFSNLARLKQLPFAGIKIDREFIRDLPNSPQDCAIFRATHAIATELNLKTVAEGIENAEQEEFVRQFDVDYVQGFRFGRPEPADKLTRYTKS